MEIMPSELDPIFQLPQDIDDSTWPKIRLRQLRMVNYCIHENVEIDLSHDGRPMNVLALVGPNGTGKTTILNAIQLLFANFTGQSPERVRAAIQKGIRNYMWLSPIDMLNAKMEVSGIFEDDGGRSYEVRITQDGVTLAHPENIQEHLSYYCFLARFDQELNQFQLKRQRWPLFQDIFAEVTGYPVEEDDSAFNLTEDIRAKKLMQEYVGGFKVVKPRETIVNRQCSAGEKKIAKCFSTILNKEVQPNIILIDNVTDHVEISRHLPVVSNIERCFPKSQIIVTCHSVPVQRNFPNRERLLDMRLLHTTDAVRNEPWRLRFYDEVLDCLEKAKAGTQLEKDNLIKDCETLLGQILNESLQDPSTAVAELTRRTTFSTLIQAQVVDSKPKLTSHK